MDIKRNVTFIEAILLLLLVSPVLRAQKDTASAFTTSVNVDLLSRYIWRGLDIGHAPSIQPCLSLSWKDFTIGAWGAYKLTGEGDQETDFFINKTFGFISVSMWDYWNFNDTIKNDFFDYNKTTTSHLLEAQVMLMGGETLPFNFLAGYFFYGADPSKSLYLELQFVPELKAADVMFFAGYQATGTYYAEKPGFVNIGCTVAKPISITDRLALPLKLSLIFSPAESRTRLVAGFYF